MVPVQIPDLVNEGRNPPGSLNTVPAAGGQLALRIASLAVSTQPF